MTATPDPPHSVQTAFWRRRPAFQVAGEGGGRRRGPKEFTEDYGEYEEYGEDYGDSEGGEISESQATRVLMKLIERIRSRIS